jgi:hypothetical protein
MHVNLLLLQLQCLRKNWRPYLRAASRNTHSITILPFAGRNETLLATRATVVQPLVTELQNIQSATAAAAKSLKQQSH